MLSKSYVYEFPESPYTAKMLVWVVNWEERILPQWDNLAFWAVTAEGGVATHTTGIQWGKAMDGA